MKINKGTNVVCMAKIVAKPDNLKELLNIFVELKRLSIQEPGCIRYELHQDSENQLIFTFVDRFVDMQAFEYHCKQEYIIKYFDNILPTITESMEVSVLNEIELDL